MSNIEHGSNPAEQASIEMTLKNGVPEFGNQIKNVIPEERVDGAEKNLHHLLESLN